MLQKHETVVSPSGDKANTSPGHYGYQKNQSFYGHNVEILWYFTGIEQSLNICINNREFYSTINSHEHYMFQFC